MMRHDITRLMIFYHVVDSMSFSKAAVQLKVSKAHISQQISQLESSMQTKLLERNTRRIELTFAGERVFQHCRNIINTYHDIEQTVAELQDVPRGVLRVTAPPAYAANCLARQLPKFLQVYPELSVDLQLTSSTLDLLAQKIDVAIRLTHTPPEDRIAKRIGSYQLVLCAASSYIERAGEPTHPQQLTEHPCLIYASDNIDTRWPFIINGEENDVYVQSRLSCNTYEPVLQAMLAGHGVARLPSYIVADAVASGDVKILLNDFMPTEIPIYAVYAQSISIPPTVRAFVEFLQGDMPFIL